MLYKAIQDGQVRVKSSNKMWFTGETNGNPFQYSCWENPMNSMRKQKDTIPEGEPPGQKVSHMLLGKSRRQLLIAPERMK